MRVNKDDEVYTATEVAELLKCSLTTVYQLVADGQLKSFRLGGKLGQYRIRRFSIDEYIANKEKLDAEFWEQYRKDTR